MAFNVMRAATERAQFCGLDLVKGEVVLTDKPRAGWLLHDVHDPETMEPIALQGFWYTANDLRTLDTLYGVDFVVLEKTVLSI